MLIQREDLYWLYQAIAKRTAGLSRRLRLAGQVERLEQVARSLEDRADMLDRSVAGLASFKWSARAQTQGSPSAGTEDRDEAEAFVQTLQRHWRAR